MLDLQDKKLIKGLYRRALNTYKLQPNEKDEELIDEYSHPSSRSSFEGKSINQGSSLKGSQHNDSV